MTRQGTDALADDLRKQRDFIAAKAPIHAFTAAFARRRSPPAEQAR